MGEPSCRTAQPMALDEVKSRVARLEDEERRPARFVGDVCLIMMTI